jgi:hypothetical protein
MSQEDIFNIISELGGEATLEEIRNRVKQKYPARTLHLYILTRLRQLAKNGLIYDEGKKWRLRKKKYHSK